MSLALHALVLDHLRTDPDRVLGVATQNIARIAGNVRGFVRGMLNDWLIAVKARGLNRLSDLLTGEDEYTVEMRNLTPFAGVLNEEEHRAVRERVNHERR